MLNCGQFYVWPSNFCWKISRSRLKNSMAYSELYGFPLPSKMIYVDDGVAAQNQCKRKWFGVFKYVEKNWQCQKPKNPIFVIFDCDLAIICRNDIQLKMNAKKKIFNVKNPKIWFLSYFNPIKLSYAEMTFSWKFMQTKNCWVFRNVEKNFQCQTPENQIFIIF